MRRVKLGRRRRDDDVDVATCLANLERLDAVNVTRLIGNPPRPALDDLAEQASRRLRTPMAFVNVLDEHHQFSVGAAGLGDEDPDARTVPVEDSYCKHVVAFDDVFVVDNALADDLVDDHPATTNHGVRAYLGVPIRKNGHCIGSFCVVDTKPRRWTDQKLAALEKLAVSVMAEINESGSSA